MGMCADRVVGAVRVVAEKGDGDPSCADRDRECRHTSERSRQHHAATGDIGEGQNKPPGSAVLNRLGRLRSLWNQMLDQKIS